jgi:hypothetical protein
LLYQVATAGLPGSDIAWPIRSMLRRQRNTTVLMDSVVGIDLDRRRVELRDREPVEFDYLVVATGATHSYFGHDTWQEVAPGLKSIDDATRIRRLILTAFERAEMATDATERERLLRFVIVGGGPTGVELAGAISELAHYALAKDFRTIDPRSASIILAEAGADDDDSAPPLAPGRCHTGGRSSRRDGRHSSSRCARCKGAGRLRREPRRTGAPVFALPASRGLIDPNFHHCFARFRANPLITSRPKALSLTLDVNETA